MRPLSGGTARTLYHCTRQEISHRPLYMQRMFDGVWTWRLVLRTWRPSLLPFPLLDTVCSQLCWLSNGHPQTICGDRPQRHYWTLASGMLHDTQGNTKWLHDITPLFFYSLLSYPQNSSRPPRPPLININDMCDLTYILLGYVVLERQGCKSLSKRQRYGSTPSR